MNILYEELPDYILVSGEKYPVLTDFRVWIQFDMLFSENNEDDIAVKFIKALKLCFNLDKSKKLPPTLSETLQALIVFYSGCNSVLPQNSNKINKANSENKNRIYSFNFDAKYIYAAFYNQYGIDLQKEKLHWWQFNSLFESLNDDNKICKIMEYRAIDLSKIKDKEQKAFYRKMKNLYKLPDMRTDSEKEMDIANNLSKLF